MIKPEILEMVEECGRTYCYGCKNKKLCVEFITHFTLVPEHYNGTQLGDVLSFLTSQEVCEWIRIGKEKYHTGCSKGTDITLMQIDLNMIYCPQCGKKIKEVSM